jgi:hypothetical protein
MMNKGILLLLLFILLLAAGTAIVVTAEETGGFSIPWWTVDGGGNTSTGSTFTLTGTIGQPDAGCSYGGDYELKSGFWQGCPIVSYVYMPLIIR